MTGRVAASLLAWMLSLTVPARANDEPDELLAGHRAEIQTLKVVTFQADGASFTMPSAANDPTLEGATLRVFDTGVGGDDNTYGLPAGGWESDGANGFRYKGAGTPADPCDSVVLRENAIAARCKGAATITPPIAGEVGIILTVGTDSKRYCLSFVGPFGKNQQGDWIGNQSPAPAACPTPPAPTPDVLMPGKTVLIVPGLRAKFRLQGASGQFFDLPNFPDGNPVTNGATIEIFDTAATGGSNSYNLPAGPKWSFVGSGFKYKGTGDPGDPCKVVRLKKNQVKATCSGTDVTLAPPFDGDVGIRVTIGANVHRYCARFDASDEVANETGLLKRKNVPAPGACP
jgi:hypothetical protein